MERKSSLPEDAPDDDCKPGKKATTSGELNPKCWSNEGTSDDLVLETKHKIFLSHSGFQKEFVWLLCEALEKRGYYPFFDKRCTSLPKGRRFPELILKAGQQCQMAIVVVSEEYFMSKWPMIELHTFVEAYRSKWKLKNPNVLPIILPLFYGLSVSEFYDVTRRERWYQQWETLSTNDKQGRIKVDEWKDALELLGAFNGISYNQEMQEIMAFRNEIVSSICNTISRDIKWDDSHIQGKSSICKVIHEKIQKIDTSQKYKAKVVGIYGVAGIGKTTICKTLCNEMSRKYEGRVCHIEFESKNSTSNGLLRKVLIDLTNQSQEDLQSLTEGQCKYMLQQNVSQERNFLAVDNVWNNHCSIKEAKMYLEAPFHKESLVLITARSQTTLELLGIEKDACFQMPELTKEEAVKLFLYHAAHGKQFVEEEDKRNIELCIKRCYFWKGGTEGYHYHPLALEALGLQLGCLGEKPSEWVNKLSMVRNFNYLSGENPVFAILRSSFDNLTANEQSLFMDVVFYYPTLGFELRDNGEFMEWLCLLHNENEDEIRSRLDRLKGRGLLQDVDLILGKICLHDLYRELAEMEVKGKYDESTDLENRRWVYFKDGDLSKLDSTPSGRCWQKLIRVGIHQENILPFDNPIESLEEIQWQYYSNIVLLKLVGLPRIRGVLNLEHFKCLRSLQLYDVVGLDRLDHLEGLKNLTYFRWSSWRNQNVCTHVGQFPASLKILRIEVDVLLGPNVLARCKNLRKLVLYNIRAESLDLSNCSSLQSVFLYEVRKLLILTGLTAKWASKLRSLEIQNCWDLVDIPGLDHLLGLERLVLEYNVNFERIPDLQNLTKLQVLKLVMERFSNEKVEQEDCFDLSIPQQLQEFRYQSWESAKALNLNGFRQLQVLDLSYSLGFASLEDLGDFPALQCLNLSHCVISSRLPDMSKWTNLKELKLIRCEIQFEEEDICMLARLPLLQPLPIGDWGSKNVARLDLVRRKVLKPFVHKKVLIDDLPGTTESRLLWHWHDWEESDLGTPPIRIERHGIQVESTTSNSVSFEERRNRIPTTLNHTLHIQRLPIQREAQWRMEFRKRRRFRINGVIPWNMGWFEREKINHGRGRPLKEEILEP